MAPGGLRREEHCASRSQVSVFAVEAGLIRWRELVLYLGDTIGEIQIKNAVAVIHAARVRRRSRVVAVSGRRKHAAVGLGCRIQLIRSQASAGHPESASHAIGTRVVYTGLLQRRRVVSQNPSMPGTIVTVGSKPDVDDPIQQKQSRALVLPLRVEGQLAAHASIAGAGR